MKLKLKSLFLAVCLLPLASCSTISTLQTITDAITAAIPILQATGTPIPPTVFTYVGAINQCIAAQSGSTAPTDTQLIAIGTCFAQTAIPNLPPGTAATVVAIINGLIKDVQAFTTQHPLPAPGATPGITPRVSPLSPADAAKLAQMEGTATANFKHLKAVQHDKEAKGLIAH